MTLTGLFIEKNDNIVCIDVSTPLKNTTPYFLHSPLLYLQTVQAPLFKQSPLYIGFSWTPQSKNWIFQWTSISQEPYIMIFIYDTHV